MSEPEKRQWSLESARAMLGEVRERTGVAAEEFEALMSAREKLAADDPGRADLDESIRRVVGRWARAMDALGLEIKGLWLVDFDNGSGYYCWRWPEERLEYFHGYEEGFSGRIRIQ